MTVSRGSEQRGRMEAIGRGDHNLVYTVIAVACIALLGAIIVPLTWENPRPAPSKSEVLASRFVEAMSTTTKLPPSVAQARATYGSDGGAACTTPIDAAYQGLATPRPGAAGRRGGTRITAQSLLRARTAISVYCPSRLAAWDAFTQDTHDAAVARAQALRAASSEA